MRGKLCRDAATKLAKTLWGEFGAAWCYKGKCRVGTRLDDRLISLKGEGKTFFKAFCDAQRKDKLRRIP